MIAPSDIACASRWRYPAQKTRSGTMTSPPPTPRSPERSPPAPPGVASRWQQTWEAEGLYNADVDASRTPYVDAHPPPNVTGELHMGHALQLAIGDTMIRWKRMQGFNALFQPGYDHAGIATQNVVE